MAPKRLLPVTVLSGFLGAGKTTLLKHLLRAVKDGEKPMKMAVIVNDMGSINLDALELKDTKLIEEEAQMIELQNGCICCNLRLDLLKSVKDLSLEDFDYLIVESTGISEPLPVAQTFTMDIEEAVTKQGSKVPYETLEKFAKLDTMVTVVDALNVYEVLGSLETLAERNATGMLGRTGLRDPKQVKEEPEAKGFWNVVRSAAWHVLTGGFGLGRKEEDEDEDEDDRSLVQLMLDQIEFANVILLSKAQLLEKPEAKEIQQLLERLNPDAKVVVPGAFFKDLLPNEVLNTGLFDMDKAEDSLEWQEALKKEKVPETLEYGVASMVYRNHLRPFHPGRLKATLTGFGVHDSSVFGGVVRGKGRFWIASAHAHPVEFHVAGRILNLEASERPFLDALPKDQFNELEHQQFGTALKEKKAAGRWHEAGYGDRDSQVIFIGLNFDSLRIREALEKALVSDEELKGGPDLWKTFEDVYFQGRYFKPFVPGMSYEG